MFTGGQAESVDVPEIGIGHVQIHDRYLILGYCDRILRGERRSIVYVGDLNGDYDFIAQSG